MRARRGQHKTSAGKTAWQEKYGGKRQTTKQQLEQNDDRALEEWIQSVQKRAEAEAEVTQACNFEHFFQTDEHTEGDQDAAEVISQMNKLLEEGPDVDAGFGDQHVQNDNSGLDFDFDKEFSSYLQPNECSLVQTTTTPTSIDILEVETFSGENMATLFRRTHDEQTLRKCFDALRSYAYESKMIKARVFSRWKRIVLHTREMENQFVRRYRRRRRVRLTRRIISSWQQLCHERSLLLQRAGERYTSRIFSSWLRVTRQKKAKRAELARKASQADSLRQAKLLRAFFVSWRSSTKRRSCEKAAALESQVEIKQAAHQGSTRSIIMMPDEGSPVKAQAVEQQVTCITPERMVSESKQEIKCVEKENKQPNKSDQDKLLLPLKPIQRRKPPRNTSTPKMIVEMKKRKEERERQREILKQRYEQKAKEKEKRLEEERQKKEEAELRVQNEYFHQKQEEERRKKMAAARWKQACRLAVLHYRMSLQKRMLKQWRKIFDMQEFNERKASIAWRDRTIEQCFKRWMHYKEEEKRKRGERMLKLQQLSDDYNERRFMAKGFAALETHCQYSQSLRDEAQSRISAVRQRSTIKQWHRITMKAKKSRRRKERKAAKCGKRLLLRRAMQAWTLGVEFVTKEREMDMLVEEKWKEVNTWLEG